MPQKCALRVTFVPELPLKAMFRPRVFGFALLLKRYRLCCWFGSLMRNVPLKSNVRFGPKGPT